MIGGTHLKLVGAKQAAPTVAFRSSVEPLLICDEQRRCVDVNVAGCLLLRMTREVVLGLRLDDLLQPDVHARLDAIWPTEVKPGDSVRLEAVACQLRPPDGGRVEVTLYIGACEAHRMIVIIDFPPVRTRLETTSPVAPRADHQLTSREREVLTLVAAGKTGLAIAAELFLAPTTVQTHVNNALMKLGARNRAHGIAIAIRSGEIDA